MGRAGSQRNEQKINARRDGKARQQEIDARQHLTELKRLPVNARPPNYDQLLTAQEGILKRAIDVRRKSETHSRTGKGYS